MEDKKIYQIVRNCSCCNAKKLREIEDRTGYYENKFLGEGDEPSFRCKKCKIIKPIENFSKVDPKNSERRRKFCRDCRNTQMKERYYKRKEEKLLKDKPQ